MSEPAEPLPSTTALTGAHRQLCTHQRAAARLALDDEAPGERVDAVGEAAQPGPRPASAPPTPSSSTSTTAASSKLARTITSLAPAYFVTFASASETT